MRRPLPLLALAVSTAAALACTGLSPVHAAPAVPPAAAQEAVPDQLLVGYVPGTSAADRQRARGRAGAVREEEVVGERGGRTPVELVRLPRGADRARAARDLKGDPAVRFAEPNWVVYALGKPTPAPAAPTGFVDAVAEPAYADGRLWGLAATPTVGTAPSSSFGSQAARAWPRTSTDPLVTARPVYVGIIDEGVKTTHPDLVDQVGNPLELGGRAGVDDDGNGKVDDVHGWDFAGGDASVYDGGTRGTADNHGTHVAGTIAGRADGRGVVGVAPHGVKLISAKFLGARGGTTANAVKAVDYLTDLKQRGVDVVASNNSWGGGGYSFALHEAIVAGAREGIVFVAAAGNGGSDGVGDDNDAGDSYPSDYQTDDDVYGDDRTDTTYDAVVAVAAIDRAGRRGVFSNYGVTDVDLGAPGVDVLSSTADNGGYSTYSGTSMATPHVAAAVALYRATHADLAATGTESALAATGRDAVGALLASSTPTEALSVAGSRRLDVAGLLGR